MAISKDGGSNPLYVYYNGNNVTEVLYNGIHVWPDGPITDKYIFNFISSFYAVLKDEDLWPGLPGKEVTVQIPESTYRTFPVNTQLGVGDSMDLPKLTFKYKYGSTNWTVHLNGNEVKTYSDLTPTVNKFCSFGSSSFWGLRRENNLSSNYVVHSGNPIISRNTYTCTGAYEPEQKNYYWRFSPSGISYSKVCTAKLPVREIVNNYKLKCWRKDSTDYNPGSSINVNSDGETYDAIWYEPVKVTYSGFNDGVGITAYSGDYRNASGSFYIPYQEKLSIKQFVSSTGDIKRNVYIDSSLKGSVQFIGDTVDVSSAATKDISIVMSGNTITVS